MKSKSIFLLTIFLIGLIPIYPAHAEDSVQRSLDDAVAFMYISDALLTEESELDDSSSSIGLSSPTGEVDTDPLLARIIHSKKMQRNDLDAVCKLLTSRLRGEGKDCEANKVQSHCDERRAEINSQIGFYHKMRGDQRKLFTRIWHSIKRNSSNFWHRIGPIGRNFLRQVGPAALQMATTGGLNSSALKNLIKHTAKSMGRERIKQVVYQGVQRLLQNQIDLALAAGVDICEPDQEISADENESPSEETSKTEDFQLPDSGKWDLSCQQTHEAVLRDYKDIVWEVTITWDNLKFEGTLDGTSLVIDENETTKWVWHEEVAGDVTEDGFLWGDGIHETTYSHAYGSNEPFVELRVNDQYWLGAISEELDKLCLFRVGAGNLDLNYIRDRGRQEMLDNPGALCEGLCTIK